MLPLWAIAARRWRGELGPLAVVALFGVAVQVAAARNVGARICWPPTCSASARGWRSGWRSRWPASPSRAARAARGSCAIVVERAGLCWLGAGARSSALTALLRPGGLFGIAQALATQQPIAKTLAAIALGVVLHALLVGARDLRRPRRRRARRVLAAAPLAWLGLVSYGVYLWHLTVAELLGLSADRGHFRADGLDLVGRIHHLDTPILFAATLAVSTAIAAASSTWWSSLPAPQGALQACRAGSARVPVPGRRVHPVSRQTTSHPR